MSDSRTPDHGGGEAPEAFFRDIDPVLNVFALANGLDLHKDPEDPPARLLGWYRDGMERFVRLEPEPGGTGGFLVWAQAHQRRDGISNRGRKAIAETFTSRTLKAELTSVLERGIEEANALTPSDLHTQGPGAP